MISLQWIPGITNRDAEAELQHCDPLMYRVKYLAVCCVLTALAPRLYCPKLVGLSCYLLSSGSKGRGGGAKDTMVHRPVVMKKMATTCGGLYLMFLSPFALKFVDIVAIHMNYNVMVMQKSILR